MRLDNKTTSLTTCQQCGGFLELESGTDPDKAYEEQKWSETYVCGSCGAKGHYHVDESNNRIDESFSGACVSYD